MSPEQATADPKLDGRSDQYSLACVVYEALAGEPPYTGPTAQAIIAKRFSEPIPKLTTLRAVPLGVEVAVTRALARSPADRYPTVAEFAAALTRPATTPKRIVTRRMAALVGGAGSRRRDRAARMDPPTFPAAEADGHPAAHLHGQRRRSGHFPGWEVDHLCVWRYSRDGPGAVRGTAPGGRANPVWLPLPIPLVEP